MQRAELTGNAASKPIRAMMAAYVQPILLITGLATAGVPVLACAG